MSLFSVLLLVGTSLNCDVTVARASNLQQATLMEQASSAVCQSLSERFESTALTLLSTGNLADEKLDARVAATVLPGQMRNGRLPVTVRWHGKPGLMQQAVLWFRVNGQGNAWRFTRDVTADHVISESDVERVTVDLASLDFSRQQAGKVPIGLAVDKPMRKGQLASADALRQPALVTRNERVRVVVTQGGLRIVTRGTALTTGWTLNDSVQVDIAESERTVLARVAGKDEVYVEM